MNEAFGLGPASYELVCECAYRDCMERMEIPGEVYERVRTAGNRYLVIAGHESSDRIVAGTGEYSIVMPDLPEVEALPAAG